MDISDCDYYILIIGGRYGSVDEDGISFTEKEYHYAVQKGLPVMAFLHEDINAIPLGKSEIDKAKRERLLRFREEVSKGRLVQFWVSAEDLNGKVAVSQVIKLYPAVGWIRGDSDNHLKNNQEHIIASYSMSIEEEEFFLNETLNENYTLRYTSLLHNSFEDAKQYPYSWKAILFILSPYLLSGATEEELREAIEHSLTNHFPFFTKIFDRIMRESLCGIIDFFFSKGIIQDNPNSHSNGGKTWSFTDFGRRVMLKLRNHYIAVH